MTTNQPIEWDTEEVLAFVHDVRPWRDLDEAERAEWVRRVKHIRDNVTTNGERWTNERLAGLFGLAEAGLDKRFRTSAATYDPARDVSQSAAAVEIRAGRRALRNPETAKELFRGVPLEDIYAAARAVNEERFNALVETNALDSDPEPTSMRAAQRVLGRADTPKTIYESGALFLFREAFGLLNTADMVFKTAGFRLSDLEETATSIREFIIMTERMEDMAKRFREALFMANAELETR